jgi:hypothetical protein
VCPQKYAYEYVMEVPRLPSTGARLLGSAFHAALAHHYLSFTDAAPADLAPPEAAIANACKDAPDGKERRAHAIMLFREYITIYVPKAEQERWEVLTVEEPLWMDIDGTPYGQRADLVWRNRSTGKVVIIDHKTIGGFGQKYGADQFVLSGQMLGYHALGRANYGDDFDGVLLNCVRTAPTGRVQDRYFRESPPNAPAAVKGFVDTIRHRRLLIESLARRYEPNDYPKALDNVVCMAYGGCDHVSRCRWGSGSTPNTQLEDTK